MRFIQYKYNYLGLVDKPLDIWQVESVAHWSLPKDQAQIAKDNEIIWTFTNITYISAQPNL
jgi:hypothetical protein